MEIVKLKINELTPYEKNAKIHTPEQIEQIKKSIEQFGMNDPIGVWGKDNIIVEGHGRLEALKELGYNEVECIRLDHLTDEERKAYTLAHNKLTMNTDFNFDILDEELADIETIDMADFGFDFDLDIEEEQEVEEDDFEIEVPEEPKAKLGDIYQLGNHRLMCGDSTSEEDISKLVDGAEMDLCVTDPPYNVNYGSIKETGYGKERDNGNKILNDNMDDESFYQFLLAFYTQMVRVLKPGGAFYIFHSDTEGYNFRKALRDAGGELKQNLIWVKNALVLGRQDYQWKHEPCLYGWVPGAGHYFIDDRTQTTVFEDKKPDFKKMKKEEMQKLLEEIYSDKISTTIINENKPLKNDVHPTMKPIRLVSRLIKNSSKPKENVIDFFGGSGSTLISCEQLGRNCYSIELDPKYVDVIIDRWETLTGEKAVLIESKEN